MLLTQMCAWEHYGEQLGHKSGCRLYVGKHLVPLFVMHRALARQVKDSRAPMPTEMYMSTRRPLEK